MIFLKTIRVLKRAIAPVKRVAKRIRDARIGTRIRVALSDSSANRTQRLIQNLHQKRDRLVVERVEIYTRLSDKRITDRKRRSLLARLEKINQDPVEEQLRQAQSKLARLTRSSEKEKK